MNLPVFLDLRKALETVDYKIMVMSLNAIGIKGITENWFVTVLRDRKQYCSLGNKPLMKAW